MIAAVHERYQTDPGQTFITGLSAGGAMTATMLATYPEIFAGGAIIAGLPHGVASGVVKAFDRMRGHGLPNEKELQAELRNASDHRGPWPRVSIWHGNVDKTVSVGNAAAILGQWRGVHDLSDRPSQVDRIGEASHRSWRGPDGRVLVEDYIIPGMGHGTPLKAKGDGAYGVAAPYMLDVGISSTFRIAQFWGIVKAAKPCAVESRQPAVASAMLPALPEPRSPNGRRIEPDASRTASGVGKVIEDALRAAGLMK